MNWNQGGTISGRFSCWGGYNLQTLPKVEEIDKCPECGSNEVSEEHDIEVLATVSCLKCDYREEGILCSSAIKKGFIAPEGMKIVNADYSSLEPRCFAFVSGDEKLKEVYWNNLDLYSKVYCDMLDPHGEYSPDPTADNYLKKAYKKGRDMIKPVVLGIAYGARDWQTAHLMDLKTTKIIKGEKKEVVDVEKGRYYRSLYLDTYPDLRKYMEKMEIEAITNGFVETLVGRRRHFKFTVLVTELLYKAGLSIEQFLDMRSKELDKQEVNEVMTEKTLKWLSKACDFNYYDEKKDAFRTWGFIQYMYSNELNNSKNVPIQGLAAHITNMGMLETTRKFKEKGLNAWVCLQVHDEIASYALIEEAEEAATLQKDGMENNKYAKLLDIAMIAEPIICDNLKESK